MRLHFSSFVLFLLFIFNFLIIISFKFLFLGKELSQA